jgi:hypothetical protein
MMNWIPNATVSSSAGRQSRFVAASSGGVDTVEEQVNIAKQKAGIFPGEEVELWRFEVERYFE